MTIGIDLDDVLASLMVSLVDFHNQRYKTTLTRNDFRHFDLWRTWGGNREEAIRKVYEFYEAKEFENVGTVPGAIDALASLKAMEHRLYVITARPNHIIKKTEVWLERHFPKTFDGVHFTNAFIVSGPSRKKVDVCKELGVELFKEALDEEVREREAIVAQKREALALISALEKAEKQLGNAN